MTNKIIVENKLNGKNFEDLTITVVGLGVIGGAYAETLTKLGCKNVYGIDIDEKILQIAEDKGIINKGYLKSKEPLEKSDFVVITLYPNIIKHFLVNNIEHFQPNCLITDVVGIKGKIMEELKPIIKNANKNIDFIFGHPMAGREKRGIEYADTNVFIDANYIIIKDSDNKESNINFLNEIILKMGFKTISYLTEQEHDEIISFTSQLTHVIAVSLVNSDNNKYETYKYIGDSFRDLTRIAQINEDLWAELFLGNKNNLLNSIKQFEDELDILKEAISNDDIGKLKERFITSTRRRQKLCNGGFKRK